MGDQVAKMAPDLPDLPILRDSPSARNLCRRGSSDAQKRRTNATQNGYVTSPSSPPDSCHSDAGPFTASSAVDSENMASGSSQGGGLGFLKEAASNVTHKLFSKLSLEQDDSNGKPNGANPKTSAPAPAPAPASPAKKSPAKTPKKDTPPKENEDEKFKESRRSSKIEKSKYATMWRNIVNNSMVGTGIVCQAAIVSQDGHVLAASKGLDIKKPQIQLLSRAIHQNPGELAVTGIVLGEENFMYTRSEYGQAVYGVDESGERGCVVCSSKRCLIMGIYDKKPEAANTLVEELAEYIRGRDL